MRDAGREDEDAPWLRLNSLAEVHLDGSGGDVREHVIGVAARRVPPQLGELPVTDRQGSARVVHRFGT
jgi:hypothetical protein